MNRLLPARIPSLEEKRVEREYREARDRSLARDLGIEIGRRREREKTIRVTSRAYAIGFFAGIIFTIIIGWLAILGNDSFGL